MFQNQSYHCMFHALTLHILSSTHSPSTNHPSANHLHPAPHHSDDKASRRDHHTRSRDQRRAVSSQLWLLPRPGRLPRVLVLLGALQMALRVSSRHAVWPALFRLCPQFRLLPASPRLEVTAGLEGRGQDESGTARLGWMAVQHNPGRHVWGQNPSHGFQNSFFGVRMFETEAFSVD